MKKTIIGIDLDNTIINYENSFYKQAKKYKLINKLKNKSKKSVKNYLIKKKKEKEWTKLQGIVYGKKIFDAKPFPYLKDKIFELINKSDVYIVSHRTKKPIIGGNENLHSFAKLWIKKNNIFRDKNENWLKKHIFFKSSIKLKVKKIINLNCTYFIDDLPQILDLLPKKVNKILFNPNGLKTKYKNFKSWKDLNLIISNVTRKN